VAVINLDPANDGYRYECFADVGELVSLDAVQEETGLGPNGGLVYCLEYLEANLDWLEGKVRDLQREDRYVLFDLPGQVELWSNHGSLRRIVDRLGRQGHVRLCTVNLVDSLLCTDVPKFVSALLLSLSGMLHVELPHVNVLSKCDLVARYDAPGFSLSRFLECRDLSSLAGLLDSGAFSDKYRRLTQEICEAVDDYGLVDFLPLAVEDPSSLGAVLASVHEANGFAYKPAPGGAPGGVGLRDRAAHSLGLYGPGAGETGGQ